jgi:hypothetical protein
LNTLSEQNQNSTVIQDDKPVRALLLSELKIQYSSEWQLRKNLDDKAKSIITVSGVITTLLFGFATLVLKDGHDPAYQMMFVYIKDLLFASVVPIILSIFLSTVSLKLQKYALPFSHASFYDEKDTKREKFDKEKIKKTIDSSLIVFNNTLIKNYLDANRINAKENNFKTLMITLAQWAFVVGISLITALVILLSTSLSQNP